MTPGFENLNAAFFFVVDKIIGLQGFFIRQSLSVGRTVLLIAIFSAGINYALTGTGLKENIIKILKATAFFLIAILAYPQIIGFISSWSFTMAKDSIYPSIQTYYSQNINEIASLVDSEGTTATKPNFFQGLFISFRRNPTRVGMTSPGLYYPDQTTQTAPGDPSGYFDSLIVEIDNVQMSYSAVPPAAVLKIIFLVAGECIRYADHGDGLVPQFSRILKGLICAFFIILTGIFAVLEYCICFLEFMLVSSVGVILFPLSIWEGSKFMSEKFIGAITGFFIKLLFINISIFLMLYGFITLAYQFADSSFGGRPDEIITVIFICLLFLYICKSAPGLAQSLLTGTPSLSATGAISAATGAVAAAGSVMGAAKKAGVAAAGGTAKAGVGAIGSLAEAGSAAGAVRDAGGGALKQARAFAGSLATDAGDSFKAGALGLTRSLLGGQGGINPHSWREDFLDKKNDITNDSQNFHEHLDKRRQEGADRAKKYI